MDNYFQQMVSDDGVEDGFRQTSDSNKDIAYPEISMEKMFSEYDFGF